MPQLAAPFELKTLKDDVEIDVDNLIQENMHYKRIHKTLSTQVHIIESKMMDLKSEISRLYSQQQQSKENEQFLKKVVKSLTRAYGYENIEKVIETVDAAEAGETRSDKGPELNYPNHQPQYAGNYETNNKNIYQQYNASSSNDEDIYSEKGYMNTSEYELMQGVICQRSRSSISEVPAHASPK